MHCCTQRRSFVFVKSNTTSLGYKLISGFASFENVDKRTSLRHTTVTQSIQEYSPRMWPLNWEHNYRMYQYKQQKWCQKHQQLSNGRCNLIHSFIFHNSLTFTGSRGLESIPTDIGQGQGTTWTSHQFIKRLTQRDTQPFMLTFTPTGNLESPINCMSLDCGRKLEYVEGTHADTRTCRLHTERSCPRQVSNPGPCCCRATGLTTKQGQRLGTPINPVGGI